MVSNNKTKLGETNDREKGDVVRGDYPGDQASEALIINKFKFK
jgi:hypothetical protein